MPGNTMKLPLCIIVSLKILLHECVNITEFCPGDRTEWERRSHIFKCNNSNSYMCLPNEQLTELVEFCYIGPTFLINPGVCLVLDKSGAGLCDYNCQHFSNGCPDSHHLSDIIYKYPECVSIGKGCFLAESSCERKSSSHIYTFKETSIRTISTEPTEANTKNMTNKVLIAVIVLCVFLIICLVGTIFWLCTKKSYDQFIFCNRRKAESEENGDGIECRVETAPFIQEGYQENKLSNKSVSMTYGHKKEKKSQSDTTNDGRPASHASITVDSGLPNTSGSSPLHIACSRGHHGTVDELLRRGGCINACDQDGKTPLYRSCENGHIEIVKLLLKNGADVNLCDHDGYSPLYAACQEGYTEIVKILLDNGSDPNIIF